MLKRHESEMREELSSRKHSDPYHDWQDSNEAIYYLSTALDDRIWNIGPVRAVCKITIEWHPWKQSCNAQRSSHLLLLHQVCSHFWQGDLHMHQIRYHYHNSPIRNKLGPYLYAKKLIKVASNIIQVLFPWRFIM